MSIIAYPHMAPELVTCPAGNGHGENSPSREFTAFVPPLILVVVAGLVALAPRFNPRFLERFPAGAVANTENSTKVLNCVLVLVGVLIAALHLGLIALYVGINAPLEAIMTTAAGIVVTGLGAVLPSFLIILCIALFFHQFMDIPWIAAMFRGIRPAVVALIAAPTFQLAKDARITLTNCWIPVVTTLLIWLLGVNPVYIIIAAGLGGFLYGKFIKPTE